MHIFQIIKEQVTIIDGDLSYIDTLDNFKLDSGLTDLPALVIYDEYQASCVVDNEFLAYPNDTYEGYIAKLSEYIAAKEKREYVAPAEPTEEEKRQATLDELKSEYTASANELQEAMNTALLAGDEESITAIREDYADLQASYKEEVSNV